jgi:hypothetical protein
MIHIPSAPVMEFYRHDLSGTIHKTSMHCVDKEIPVTAHIYIYICFTLLNLIHITLALPPNQPNKQNSNMLSRGPFSGAVPTLLVTSSTRSKGQRLAEQSSNSTYSIISS